MIYSVHFYYSKVGSRKGERRFETIIFAQSKNHAEELARNLFKGYPAKIENLNVMGGLEKSLEEIYEERPELMNVPPERGYIYDEFTYRNRIRDYYNK